MGSTSPAFNLGDLINTGVNAVTSGIGMAYNANQSRLAYERTLHMMSRAFLYNEEAAENAYHRELEADSSKYQRQVADMKAAGINPMLAAGSGAGSVSSPAGSVSNPSSSPGHSATLNLGDVMAMRQFKLQEALNQAQVRNIDAQTANTEADTAQKRSAKYSIDLANEITEATKEARIESAKLANDLSHAQISKLHAQLGEITEHIHLMAEQAATEDSKRQLNAAQAALARANAHQIIELLPYEKELKSAQSEAQRQAALLSAAHTAYQNHLIDDGYIDAFIAEQKSKATSAEARAEIDRIKSALRTGDWSGTGIDGANSGNALGELMQVTTILLDNCNPLVGLLGGR